jgi:hypothetical protein
VYRGTPRSRCGTVAGRVDGARDWPKRHRTLCPKRQRRPLPAMIDLACQGQRDDDGRLSQRAHASSRRPSFGVCASLRRNRPRKCPEQTESQCARRAKRRPAGLPPAARRGGGRQQHWEHRGVSRLTPGPNRGVLASSWCASDGSPSQPKRRGAAMWSARPAWEVEQQPGPCSAVHPSERWSYLSRLHAINAVV